MVLFSSQASSLTATGECSNWRSARSVVVVVVGSDCLTVTLAALDLGTVSEEATCFFAGLAGGSARTRTRTRARPRGSSGGLALACADVHHGDGDGAVASRALVA